MIFFQFAKTTATLLALPLFCSVAALATAQEYSSAIYENSGPTVDLGTGKFQSFPVHVTVAVRGGYDDNVFSTPFDEEDSFFANIALGVRYDFGSPRTKLSLKTGVGYTYYFDTSDDESYDVNAYLGFSITHRASARLTLSAAVFLTYQSAPDFTTLTSGLSLNTRSRDFLYTINKFSAAYLWTPRFSTVTSYTFGAVSYDDGLLSEFEDRFEHTFGNEFRYLIWPTTTIVFEHRFGLVHYQDDDDRDSMSHFFLGGFDHSFSPRFNASVRAGVEFRQYDDHDPTNGFSDGDRTHPYGEATLTYALGQSTSLTWLNRYSLEQPDVPEAISRSTYRTGLSVRHAWTPRISSALGLYYQHDWNDDTFFDVSEFSEDAIDVSLSTRYALSRNWSLEAGYHHTRVWSDSLFRDYERNRYWLGAAFTF